MKHAFSRIRNILIQLLAYVLCTLCKEAHLLIKGQKFCLDIYRAEHNSPGPECDCELKEGQGSDSEPNSLLDHAGTEASQPHERT